MTLTMLDTRLIYIGDRESDIVAMMRRARDMGHPADWLVRSQKNRTLLGGGKLWAQATTGEAGGGIEFSLAARPGQTASRVRQYV